MPGLDRLGESAGRVDAVPAAEEGRAEGAVFCAFAAMGLFAGLAADVAEAVYWNQGGGAGIDFTGAVAAFGVLCGDGDVAFSGGVPGAAGGEAGSVGCG